MMGRYGEVNTTIRGKSGGFGAAGKSILGAETNEQTHGN